MKLIFTSTGDYLSIVEDNKELAEFWVDSINIDKVNLFNLTNSNWEYSLIEQLNVCLTNTNTILAKFKLFPFAVIERDWFNQHNLNILHEQWVKLQHNRPNIVHVISKFGDTAIKEFHNINTLIHQIEQSTTAKYVNHISPLPIWQIKNPFGSDILRNGRWNVELHYQNLGRSLYEKWMNFDDNIIDTDTNNFTHIGGEIILSTSRPYVCPLPIDYVDYCAKHNITPLNAILPLGNFCDYQFDLTNIRHIIYRNMQIENNRISFEI